VEGSQRVEWFLDEAAEALAAGDTVHFVNVGQLIVRAPAKYSPLSCTPEVSLQ